ncbi:MAG TPA: hypothetical protein VFU76_12180 [Terriglobales bacterium]|nr:hypothetical protein [Terriglobales bacterium]
MKKLTLLLAVVFLFALTAVAQESGAASSGQGMSQDQSSSMSKKGKKMGAMGGKTATLTGCVSKDADAEGMYTLTNGRIKKGVEIGPTDKVKDHAGHQVKLSGHWATAAAAGESSMASSSSKEKGERHFEVDSVQHISDTCSEAPGGGTMGMASHKKGKKGAGTGTPQQ